MMKRGALKDNRTYQRVSETAGEHVRSGSGSAGVIMVMLLLLGSLISACKDQPIDSTGVTIIKDTIRISRDSVVIRDSIIYKDSVVIRDSIFYRDSIVLRDSVVIKDSVAIRDSVHVRYKDSVRLRDSLLYDTIKVPENIWRTRSAILYYTGYDATDGANTQLREFEVDLTEWLQYSVVDSSNFGPVGISLSMSAAIPPEFLRIANRNNALKESVYLRGIALNVPMSRLYARGGSDSISLSRHPYDWFSEEERDGGMMITVYPETSQTLEHWWTGQITEVAKVPGVERYRSRGAVRINEIDYQKRMIFAEIEGVFYSTLLANEESSLEEFPINISLQLGY